MHLKTFSRHLGLCLLAGLLLLSALHPAQAADRERLRAFVNTIGYDVMLESMGQSARAAPRMLGVPDGAFGLAWEKAATEAFDRDGLVADALTLLEPTLNDRLLNHAVEFYASPLGARLVEAENAAHMADDATSRAEGQKLVEAMAAEGSDRADLLNRMSLAVGGPDTGVRIAIELRVRFLTAADAAGVVRLRVDTDALRARLEAQSDELRAAILKASLISSAYTYRDFTDDEVRAYVEALENPDMALVYQLLQAVQFELQARRYEDLAAILARLTPAQEL